MPAPDILRQVCRRVEGLGQQLLLARVQQVEIKPQAGLVTDLDLAIEEELRPWLEELLPGSRVVGEELGGDSGDWTWWLDPIDGTTNFVHGWPRSAISLALYQGPVAHWGVIYDPYRQEMFWAQKGEGAWCGSTRLQVGACSDLAQALLTTGFAPTPPQQWELCRSLQARSRGLRVSGCASLDLAYVACGRVDVFWEVDLKPWDVAAGLLLVEEAGGQVRDFRGNRAQLQSGNYLAANLPLVQQLGPEMLALQQICSQGF